MQTFFVKDMWRRASEWSVIALLFFLPWQARWFWNLGELNGGYFEYGTKSVYVFDVMLIVAVLLRLSYFFKYEKGIFARQAGIFLWCVGCLELLIFLSAFWAFDAGTALYGWARFLLAFGLGYILWSFPRVLWPRLVLSVALAGGIQSILAVFQFFLQKVFASTWLGMATHLPSDLGASVVGSGGERLLRAYGSFPHPNMLGGFLVFASVCFLAATSMRWEGRMAFLNASAVRLGGLALLFIGLFFTFSRSAWVAAFAVIVFLVFAAFQTGNVVLKKAWREYAAMLFLILAIFGGVFFQTVKSRIAGGERLEALSSEERIASVGEAAGLIRFFPWQGVGMWNYGFAVHDVLDDSRPSWSYQPVHTIFLLVWSELGVFGLIVFAGLFGFVGARMWKERKSVPPERFFFAAAILAFAVIGFFDHYPWSLASGPYLLASAFGFVMLGGNHETYNL